MKRFKKIGLVGRWKPFHNGSKTLLEAACTQSEEVLIGVGPSNQDLGLSMRNPFTLQESKDMINAALGKKYHNYRIIDVPDFGHIPRYRDGKKWTEYVIETFGSLDAFVSGNPYVVTLLKPHYQITSPQDLIPKDKKIRLKATRVRYYIAVNDPTWKELVPIEVADYLESNGLIQRFQEQFGKKTIDYVRENPSCLFEESEENERRHVQRV